MWHRVHTEWTSWENLPGWWTLEWECTNLWQWVRSVTSTIWPQTCIIYYKWQYASQLQWSIVAFHSPFPMGPSPWLMVAPLLIALWRMNAEWDFSWLAVPKGCARAMGSGVGRSQYAKVSCEHCTKFCVYEFCNCSLLALTITFQSKSV